jgi:hypothetical protein
VPDYNSPAPLSLTDRLLIITLTLSVLPALTPLLAQTRYLVDTPGTWKPWTFTATAEARKEQAAPAALVKSVEAELVALCAVLRQAPGVASPRGFSVETSGSLPRVLHQRAGAARRRARARVEHPQLRRVFDLRVRPRRKSDPQRHG